MKHGTLVMLAAIWVLHCQAATALAPPHPDFSDWESVHDMRRRLGVEYKYHPSHVSPEECRYLTENECQTLDERRAKRHLNVSTGDALRVLVLLIKFKDQADKEVPPREYYDELFNGDGTSDINTVGSIKHWLRYNSLGKYRVSFDVRDWQVTDGTEASYAAGVSGFGADLEQVFAPVLTRMDSAGEIDWFDGYVDEFGYLNHLVVLHSGIAAEVGDIPCVAGSHKDRIWSAGSSASRNDNSWVSEDFFQVAGFTITSAFSLPKCDKDNNSILLPPLPAPMNVISHEYCHGFGIPDLYDQSGLLQSIGGLGRFDTMASNVGWDGDGATPGYLSAYSREKIGWIKTIPIEHDGIYALQPLAWSTQIYRIDHGYPEGEYLLIELKQPLKWDSDVPMGGVIIYHIDEKADRQVNNGSPEKPTWPKDHYRVAVQQADRMYDIENGRNDGTVEDFWRRGMKLDTGGTYPNTDSYQGGVVKPTGVSIEILSNPGLIMLFKVEGIGSRSAGLPSSPEINNDSAQGSVQGPSRDSTGEVLAWLLSMLAGLGLMVGLVVLVL